MIQSDFIIRQIEKLGILFAALRRRILAGKADPGALREELMQAADEAGFDLDLLIGLNQEALFWAVAPGGDVDPLRCWMAAEVLYLHGLQAAREDDVDAAIDALTKARVFFEMSAPNGTLIGFPEAEERIVAVDGELAALGPGAGLR